MKLLLRSALGLALVLAALSASAQATAFSDLGSAPKVYNGNNGYFFGAGVTEGFQFTSTATGLLEGFEAAVNDDDDTEGFADYTLSLYTDSGSSTLGALLGSYSGTSTGETFGSTSSALSSVPATGAPVLLASGTAYWLVLTGPSVLDVDDANSGTQRRYFNDGNGFETYFDGDAAAAFSVQVAPVPEPSALAALGVGAAALARRRKRA